LVVVAVVVAVTQDGEAVPEAVAVELWPAVSTLFLRGKCIRIRWARVVLVEAVAVSMVRREGLRDSIIFQRREEVGAAAVITIYGALIPVVMVVVLAVAVAEMHGPVIKGIPQVGVPVAVIVPIIIWVRAVTAPVMGGI
jgi:hypothetical protein